MARESTFSPGLPAVLASKGALDRSVRVSAVGVGPEVLAATLALG